MRIAWGIYITEGVSNLLGGDFGETFGVIVKGGRFSLGLICRGKSFEAIYTLKCKKFLDAVVDASPL